MGRPGRPGDNYVQNLPSRIRDRNQWQNWRQEHRDDIRDFWQNHAGDFNNWFDGNWWNNYGLRFPYYPGFGYWGWAAWGGLADWVDYGWTDPVYYNYGENVYYEDGSVYYGDQPVCTELEYIQQAEAIATNVPETKPADKDWMPLGVFAITPDGKTAWKTPAAPQQPAANNPPPSNPPTQTAAGEPTGTNTATFARGEGGPGREERGPGGPGGRGGRGGPPGDAGNDAAPPAQE